MRRKKLSKIQKRKAAAAGTTRQFEAICASKVARWAQRKAAPSKLGTFGAASPCRSLVVGGSPVSAEGAAALAAASAQMGGVL